MVVFGAHHLVLGEFSHLAFPLGPLEDTHALATPVCQKNAQVD